MNKQNIFEKEPMSVKYATTTPWLPTSTPGSEAINSNNDDDSSQPWLNILFENLGEILTGASSIVGAANTSYHRTETKNENINKNSFSWTNGTTITAMVIGGVAIFIVLILIFRKKD